VATILSLNGAKNNPKIATKITAVRPKEGFPQAPPPKYATVHTGRKGSLGGKGADNRS